MNERIDVLALQATDSKGGLNRHKFAELIVREYLSIVYEVRGEPTIDTHFVIKYDRAYKKIIDAIEETLD